MVIGYNTLPLWLDWEPLYSQGILEDNRGQFPVPFLAEVADKYKLTVNPDVN